MSIRRALRADGALMVFALALTAIPGCVVPSPNATKLDTTLKATLRDEVSTQPGDTDWFDEGTRFFFHNASRYYGCCGYGDQSGTVGAKRYTVTVNSRWKWSAMVACRSRAQACGFFNGPVSLSDGRCPTNKDCR